jgi:hypothetical protein
MAQFQGGEQERLDQIVLIARMMVAVDRGEGDEDEFQRMLDAPLDFSTLRDALLAAKLISGLPYHVISDNPETIRRARAIVQHVGGVVASIDMDGVTTSIRFDPPKAKGGLL